MPKYHTNTMASHSGQTWLVTGGCGFIGSHLVDRLVGERVNVVNIDMLSASVHRASESRQEKRAGEFFYKVDIGDQEAIRDILIRHRPSKVLNLAAETHVDRSISDASEFFRTNVDSTWRFVDECTRFHGQALCPDGFRFVHVSTDEVYGSRADGDHPSAEGDRFDPRNPYSASKAASEHIVRAWGNTYGLPWVVTNCSNNYGPRQFREKFIPNVVTKALAGLEIPIYGDGRQMRDWLHVEDHVSALVAVASRASAGRTYCIGGDGMMTNMEMLQMVVSSVESRGVQCRHLVKHVTDRLGHDRRYQVDSGKIHAELGWEPLVPILAGVDSTVEWYMANGSWGVT